MTFNLEHMKEQTNAFWEAYFQALDVIETQRGKPIEEVPIVMEFPITDELMFRVGRNSARWKLVYTPVGAEFEVNEIDIATRAFALLTHYLEYVV